MSRYDMIVVGGGVVGLGIAWQLAQRQMDVLVLERDQIGAGASGAAAGMLAPTSEVHFEELDLLRLGQLSLEMYPDFVAQLEAQTDINLDFRQEGTLVVGVDRDDAVALKRLYDYQQMLKLDVQWCDAQQARALEPGLSPNINAAVFCPTDHQIDPPALIQALEQACLRSGVSILEETPVAQVNVSSEQVQGVMLADGRVMESERVLIAAGAWTRSIKGLTPGVLPRIRPVRGQMIALDCSKQPLCHHVIRAPDAYLVPKTSGRLIIGATMEEMGFDARLTAGGVFELLRGAWETLPGVYDAPILDLWTGFRPLSLTSQPILGPAPRVDGLWLATGHGRNGILLAAITAMEMARMIVGESCVELIEKFSP